MNKYDVYTVFTLVNKTEVLAKNEKSAIKKIKELAETTDVFSQGIPFEKKIYNIKDVKLIEKNADKKSSISNLPFVNHVK